MSHRKQNQPPPSNRLPRSSLRYSFCLSEIPAAEEFPACAASDPTELTQTFSRPHPSGSLPPASPFPSSTGLQPRCGEGKERDGCIALHRTAVQPGSHSRSGPEKSWPGLPRCIQDVGVGHEHCFLLQREKKMQPLNCSFNFLAPSFCPHRRHFLLLLSAWTAS